MMEMSFLGQKNIKLFLRSFFWKTDAAVHVLIFIQHKTDVGTFYENQNNIF